MWKELWDAIWKQMDEWHYAELILEKVKAP